MLTAAQQEELIRKYFVEISPEDFRKLLKESNPHLFRQKSRTKAARPKNGPRVSVKHRGARSRPIQVIARRSKTSSHPAEP